MSQDSNELHLRTLTELRQGLVDNEFSATELTSALLTRIENVGASLNAFITLTGEQALAAAADPPDDPPGDKVRSHGFFVTPK